MNSIIFNKANTQVIAHRGLSGIESENTNAAFVAAGNRSYYGIETDIYRTADGRFVINHDRDFMRVAGEDMDVETSNLSEIQDIILFGKDGSKDRTDLRPSTLENYISICKKYDKHAVLELKSVFTKEEMTRIIDIIKSFNHLDNTTFISFHYDNLLTVRNMLPNQSVQFLFGEFTNELIEKLIADKIDVDVFFKALNKETIDLLHSAGLKVNCWTVDNPEIAEQLCTWGVEFITSNILE